MTHGMTCQKHGLVEGRLFASGDVLCPKCLDERLKSAAENLAPGQEKLLDRKFGTSMGATVPPKKEW